MTEARKWEELPRDCLVDVLGRVGLESLLLDIPFVCKSWYKASFNPLCWKQLDFLHLYFNLRINTIESFINPIESFINRFVRQYYEHGGEGEFCDIKFVKGVVDRSAGCATYVTLPSWYGEEQLSYVVDNCPALKTLVLRSPKLSTMLALSSVIGKFKYLEMLGIRRRSGSLFKDIVTQIGAHCQNFTALSFVSDRFNRGSIGEDEVMSLVSCLPKLKDLTLKGVKIKRENLIKLLIGCVGLVHLDVRHCYGFDENDEQLLNHASHIPTFESSGSVLFTPDKDYYYDEDEDDDDSDYGSFCSDSDDYDCDSNGYGDPGPDFDLGSI